MQLAAEDFVTTCLEAHAMGLGLKELQLQLILLEGSLTGAFAIRNQRYSDDPVMSEVNTNVDYLDVGIDIVVKFTQIISLRSFSKGWFACCDHYQLGTLAVTISNLNLVIVRTFGAYCSFVMCRRVEYDHHGFVLFTRRWLRYPLYNVFGHSHTFSCFNFITSLPCGRCGLITCLFDL